MAEIDSSDITQRGKTEHAEQAAQARPQRRIGLPPYETGRADASGRRRNHQAGVYQGLYEAGIQPNWIAGISIGALNTATIAGTMRPSIA